jgi:hypothetical protein
MNVNRDAVAGGMAEVILAKQLGFLEFAHGRMGRIHHKP